MKGDRLTAIRQQLYERGTLSIGDLAQVLETSVATVRRDLATLESQGGVERVHGGARLAQGGNIEVAFEQREKTNLAAKRRIADLAFDMLRPHTTIFLDAGTTVLQLARRLRLSPLPLTAVTNGLPVAQELMSINGVRVMILGGELRPENASIVGPFAESQIDRMQFDQLFIGAGAITPDLGIYTSDLTEANLNTRMLSRSRERIVMADAEKFGRSATFLVAPVTAATHVISDDALDASWQQRLATSGLTLHLAAGDQ